MRQYALPTHPTPGENAAKDTTLDHEGARVSDDEVATPAPLTPLLEETPQAPEYYHLEVKDSGGFTNDLFISQTYQDKSGNTHVLDPPAPPPPPPPSQDPGLQSQDHGPTVAPGRPYREQLVINHYPPNPPAFPVWPQDIWVHSGTCRVLYQPVMVISNPIPGQPTPAPFRPGQAAIPPLAEDVPSESEVVADMLQQQTNEAETDNTMGHHRSIPQGPPAGPESN